MRSKDIVVFDLDGTLADDDHRRNLVADARSPEEWNTYYSACGDDTPIEHTIAVWHALKEQGGYHHWILTGRSDLVQDKTVAWLYNHNLTFDKLCMRREGDYRPDHEVKGAWIREHIHRVAMVFEDRDTMVEWWRGQGVPCFQVRPSAY